MTTNAPQTQSHPHKQHSKKETAMKRTLITMVAMMATLLTTLAPQIAWAVPPPQCVAMGNKLISSGCKDTALLKEALTQCPDQAKAECPDQVKILAAEASKAPAKVEEKPALAEIKDAPKVSEAIDCNKSVVLTGVSLIDNSKRLLFCFEQRKTDCEASLGDIAAAQTETAATLIRKKVQANLVQKMKDAVNSVSPAVEACVTQSGSRIEDMKLMTNLLESMPSGNTILGIPADLKGHTVEFTLNDGSTVEGEVLEIGDDTVTVKLADGTTRDLKKSDIKGFSKVKMVDNVKVGDKATLKDLAGNTVSPDLKVTGTKDGLEVTGAIERGTGLPFKVEGSYFNVLMGYNGDKSVKGNALNGFKVSTGWEFRLSPAWFLIPFVSGGFGYVTGESSERRFDTPSNERMVGILGGGLKAGFDTGKFSPYLVAEGFGLPGPGVSGGIGTQWHFSDLVALDASLRWTFIPDTGVRTGIRNLNDLGNVRVNGLGLTLGVAF